MKDQQAREEIAILRRDFESYKNLQGEMRSVKIMDCPKCKHKTPQFPDPQPTARSYTLGRGTISYDMDTSKAKNVYRCLVCGRAIYHGTKEVHEIIKEGQC
jgi:ribosomal protein S27E